MYHRSKRYFDNPWLEHKKVSATPDVHKHTQQHMHKLLKLIEQHSGKPSRYPHMAYCTRTHTHTHTNTHTHTHTHTRTRHTRTHTCIPAHATCTQALKHTCT